MASMALPPPGAPRSGPLALIVAAAIVGVLAVPASGSATLVPHLGPEQVDELAARIVVARCVDVQPATRPSFRLPVTEYTFAVESVVKGRDLVAAATGADGHFRIRQVGGTRPDGTSWHVIGLPAYRVGGLYRLALHPDSSRGLTSPVGFSQGVQDLSPAAAVAPAPAGAPGPRP